MFADSNKAKVKNVVQLTRLQRGQPLFLQQLTHLPGYNLS